MERSFALILDRGGMRRVWLRGYANIHKRNLIHIVIYDFGLIMRLLTGAGIPRGLLSICLAFSTSDAVLLAIVVCTAENQFADIVILLVAAV